MCRRCNGDYYRGVGALFNGDLQTRIHNSDRSEWVVVSPNIIVYVSEDKNGKQDTPLVRLCEQGIGLITSKELAILETISVEIDRPIFGEP